jgi:hypothetical protein
MTLHTCGPPYVTQLVVPVGYFSQIGPTMTKIFNVNKDPNFTASDTTTSYPGSFLLGSKDPGRRWSRDLLKSSRFLINYLGFLYDNHTKCKL